MQAHSSKPAHARVLYIGYVGKALNRLRGAWNEGHRRIVLEGSAACGILDQRCCRRSSEQRHQEIAELASSTNWQRSLAMCRLIK